MQCGPVRYRGNTKQQAAAHPFEHKVMVRPTDFRPLRPANPNVRQQFQELYAELIADEERNRLVHQDVIQALREGRSPLVLTERNEHLDSLAKQLGPEVRHLVVLRGGMRKKELDALPARLAAIPAGETRVILATGRYVGEGFDDARLDTLFLTLPISWHGTIAQYVGRLHRLYGGKREVRVYDYADLNVPMLARMFDRRCRGYEAIGYKIQLPGSAVPGGLRTCRFHRSRVEEPIRLERALLGPRWRRFSAGKFICRRCRNAFSECRGRKSSTKRQRSISVSPT